MSSLPIRWIASAAGILLPTRPFATSLKAQNERVTEVLDTRLYELVGELYKYGFDGDRYDRIGDFTRTVGIVPISAVTGEGVPDLLMILAGLAQRFLKDNLKLTATGPGVGTILEVKEEKGLGVTLDVILYNGEFNSGDTVIVGTAHEPVVTKIRALLKPKPLAEIRSEERFLPVKHVVAASGVKISAPKIENALAGSTIRVVSSPEEVEALSQELKSELEAVRIDTENEGVILKSDTLGSLEALVGELKARKIPIHFADVGPISRRDVIKAVQSRILCFRPSSLIKLTWVLTIPPMTCTPTIAGLDWRKTQSGKRRTAPGRMTASSRSCSSASSAPQSTAHSSP